MDQRLNFGQYLKDHVHLQCPLCRKGPTDDNLIQFQLITVKQVRHQLTIILFLCDASIHHVGISAIYCIIPYRRAVCECEGLCARLLVLKCGPNHDLPLWVKSASK